MTLFGLFWLESHVPFYKTGLQTTGVEQLCLIQLCVKKRKKMLCVITKQTCSLKKGRKCWQLFLC